MLVPADDGSALDALEADLDLQASVVRVRVDARTQVTLVAPLADEHWEWTVERAFELAGHSRARLTLVRADDRPRRMAAAAALESDGIAFERVGLGDAVRRLVEEPRGLDVLALQAGGRGHRRRGGRLHVARPVSQRGGGSGLAARASSGRRTAPRSSSPARASPTRAR